VPRERIREVIDVGTGQPAVPGLPSSSLGALGGTWLVIDRTRSAFPPPSPRGSPRCH
jgi:hypothetical protein